MANTQTSDDQAKAWYLDSGCNNHMNGNKNLFIMLDESLKNVIRFADGRRVTSEGKGNIVVVRKDGQKAMISDILYVPFMTSNLISICQLLAKGYNMEMEDNHMKLYDYEGRLILRAPLAKNKTFEIQINMVDHQCLASTIREYKIGYGITGMDT